MGSPIPIKTLFLKVKILREKRKKAKKGDEKRGHP